MLKPFHAQPKDCIFVCAPSNPATDTLVMRLREHLFQHRMLRLNGQNRTFAGVPDKTKPYFRSRFYFYSAFSCEYFIDIEILKTKSMRFLLGTRSCSIEWFYVPVSLVFFLGALCTNRALMIMWRRTSSSSKDEICGSATLGTSHWRSKLRFVIIFGSLVNLFFLKERRLKDPNPNYWFRFQCLTHNYLTMTTTIASFHNLRPVEILISVYFTYFPLNLDFPDTSESRSYCRFGDCSSSWARGFITRQTFRTTFTIQLCSDFPKWRSSLVLVEERTSTYYSGERVFSGPH